MSESQLSNQHRNALACVERRMQAAGLPALAIATFRHYFLALAAGQTGLLPESSIRTVDQVQALASLPANTEQGQAALDQCVMIRLNGGLGTSMGLNQAKSLLPVKQGMSFLELIARQVLHLRQHHDKRVPLLLMNSFNTESDSLQLLARFPELAAGQADIPLSFLQHKVPRLLADSLEPVSWPSEPHREWCPPGHGDLYTALDTSGLLDKLLDRGYRWAFVANADNLGASLDPRILDLMAREQIPFLMEVTRRTLADRKGGHVALDAHGQLLLRESAQCPEQDQAAFQNIERHRYFNTNNLWLDLQALKATLRERNGILGLPLIRNLKHVVPEDRSTPTVIQAETAMGAAIAVFEGARIIEVPRTRFAPVKTTSDLLALWSDRFELNPDGSIHERGESPLVIDLDPEFYSTIQFFQARFPNGAPSLIGAKRFRLRGDIEFGRAVIVRGKVSLVAESGKTRKIDDGCVLENLDEDQDSGRST